MVMVMVMMMMMMMMLPPFAYGERQQCVGEPGGEVMTLPFERRLRTWLTWPWWIESVSVNV